MVTADRKCRFYHVTPDRLVVAMLIVEVLLFFSERFRWLPFNRQKGLTVMITAAIVAAVMVVMLLWYLSSLFFRVWFQFTIRSLFFLTVVAGLLFNWIANELGRATKQRMIVEAALRLNGPVCYDYQVDESGKYIPDAQPSEPRWLRRILGDDFFANVTSACANDDDGVGRLRELKELKVVILGNLFYDTNVTDIGLQRLDTQSKLRTLILDRSQISDLGLKYLTGLPQLEDLSLRRTQVTDTGLKELTRLDKLDNLNLADTRIGNAGLQHLKAFSNLRWLDISGTRVTDVGLQYLDGLTHLESLNLSNTEITDSGVRPLKLLSGLQSLGLSNTRITDMGLGHLKNLSSLKVLALCDTRVTDAGLKHIANLGTLEILSLLRTDVTVSGLRILSGLRKLRVLHVPHRIAKDAAANEIRKWLPDCQLIPPP